jgi:hypothetical protein
MFNYFLTSCSYFGQNKKQLDGLVVPDVTSRERRYLPKVDQSNYDEGLMMMGPPVSKNSMLSMPRENTPVVGLILGPGMIRTACHISFLKALEEEGISIHIISGVGYGAVLAASYAAGFSSQKIEWNIFNFFHSDINYNPLSKKWDRYNKNYLEKIFNNLDIGDLKLSFVLPMYDANKKEVKFLKSGRVSSLTYKSSSLLNKADAIHLSAINEDFFQAKEYRNMGADVVIGIDVLGDDLTLLYGNDYLIGLFGRVISNIKAKNDDIDLFYTMPTSDMPLDSTIGLASHLQRCYNKSKLITSELKIYLSDWQKKNQRLIQ